MIRQAILLAAGRGTRMWPLTATIPKPLIPVANRPLLAHLLDSLRGAGLKEVVLIVPPEEAIPRFLGVRWKGMHLRYIVQKVPRGTGDALLQAEAAADERFLVVNGDVWIPAEEIRSLARKGGLALAVRETDRPEHYGVVRRQGTRVVDVIEKPRQPAFREVNAGLYALERSVFRWLRKTPRSPRGEIELTWALRHLLRTAPVRAVACPRSFDISYPWDLLTLNRLLLENMKPSLQGRIEKGAVIRGPVVVDRGARVRSGSYIEGPTLIGHDCDIGPNCYLRGATSIGHGVRIGNAVEIKNSIIMGGTRIGHLSYVGDSIIGEGCNLGAGTITANLRLDEQPIRVRFRGDILDTRLRKLGAILGDGVHTGIHCGLNTGILVSPGTMLPPARFVSGRGFPANFPAGSRD